MVVANPARESSETAAMPSASRRSVLRAALGAMGAGAALVVGAGASHARGLPSLRVSSPLRIVYRFSTRGRRACKACRIHHRYVVGASLRALDEGRAHPGCNCPILRQVIPVGEFAKLFPEGRGVADLRKV
jgi:hypothetical protein